MPRRRTLIGATLALALLATMIPTLSTAAPDTKTLSAKLDGNSEVPGPGDNNGKGDVTVLATPSKRKVCFGLDVRNLDPIHAAHIHRGAEDVAGPIKVTLFEDEAGLDGDGAYEGCIRNLKRKLVRNIANRPERFYVNVHTGEYPDGAIRGQLAPAP